MKPVCDRFEHDWELVHLGVLEPAEMEEALAHLGSGCVMCNERFRIASETVSAIGTSLPSKTPQRRTEQALLNRIRTEKSHSPAALLRPFPFGWALAAALALAALAGWWQHWNSSRQLADALATIASLRSSQQTPRRVRQSNDRMEVVDDAVRGRTEPAGHQNSDGESIGARNNSPQVPSPSAIPTPSLEQDESMLTELRALRREVDDLLREIASAQDEKQLLRASFQATQEELEQLREQKQQAPSTVASGAKDIQEQQRILRELQNSRRQQALMAAELERTQRVLRILRASDLKQVELKATDTKAGRGNARLLVSPAEGFVLVAKELPKLPADKTYQLWIIGETNPAVVSGGLLRMDDSGAAAVVSGPNQTLRRATGFAITDEPRAGSVVARGTKLLFGTL